MSSQILRVSLEMFSISTPNMKCRYIDMIRKVQL